MYRSKRCKFAVIDHQTINKTIGNVTNVLLIFNNLMFIASLNLDTLLHCGMKNIYKCFDDQIVI